jgi:hypothetical protein
LNLNGVRNMGVYWVASKGSGKCRGLGRWLVKGDVLGGVPGLVIDPAGGTIDNLLDSLVRLPVAQQMHIWRRSVYVDMGHSQAVMPFPLYYKSHPLDLPIDMAQRYLDVVRMLDPHLQTASIEGWNALYQCGLHTGIALSALGAQVSEAPELLANPLDFKLQLTALYNAGAFEEPTLDFFIRELPGWKAEFRSRRTASFMQKISIFGVSRPLKAMFAASRPGIDWQQIVNSGKTVLVDLRNVHDVEMQRFKLLWVLQHFLQFIKQRGAGRHTPVALTIDEVSVLTNLDRQSQNEPFADLLDDLLNIRARQGQVWVTLSHQEAWQVSEKLQKTLMGCGTRIIGRTSDQEAARHLAEQFFVPDPHRVKWREASYSATGQVSSVRKVTYSLEEQRAQFETRFRELDKFHFFMTTVATEGGGDAPLRRLNMTTLDAGLYPNDQEIATLRAQLHLRSAQPVAQVLEEISARKLAIRAQALEVKQPVASAIVASNQYDSEGYKVE